MAWTPGSSGMTRTCTPGPMGPPESLAGLERKKPQREGLGETEETPSQPSQEFVLQPDSVRQKSRPHRGQGHYQERWQPGGRQCAFANDVC